jgi:hypothetical protein
MLRRAMVFATTLALGAALVQAPASAVSGAGTGHAMFHEVNNPNIGGNALDFFERRSPDGTTKRYLVAATTTGFDIVDVTTSDAPKTVSRYLTPGGNYHPWVQVNGPRNIVALSIEEPAPNAPNGSLAHGGSNGIEFVDISDLAKPVQLSVLKSGPGCSSLGPAPVGCARFSASSGLQGPHTIRMIGDHFVYTTLPTRIINYADPANPVNLYPEGLAVPGHGLLCGHEFFEDPNHPGRTYVGFCGTAGDGNWGILDTTDPANPKLIMEMHDRDIEYAHEAYPSPDSSVVAVTDFRTGPAGGQSYTRCPGGGVHFYDISGKYKPGASLTNPIAMGTYFAPFTGLSEDAPVPPTTNPNYGPCNDHSIQFQTERSILALGLYMGGTWVLDPNSATAPGGAYTEYALNPGKGLGPTTWGNTLADWHNPGDLVNATQWYPFDAPAADRSLFVNGLARGLDVLEYEGPLVKKLSRIRIDGSAPGGVVSGVLDRYATLSYSGWVNKPLAGKTIEITSGGTTVTAVTGADGSFSANLGLSSGSHNVTVTWAGDADYGVSSLSRTVQS